MHSAQKHPIAGVCLYCKNKLKITETLLSVAPCLPEAQFALGKIFNLRNITV